MKIAILFGQFEGYEEYPGADIEAAKPKRKRRRRRRPTSRRSPTRCASSDTSRRPSPSTAGRRRWPAWRAPTPISSSISIESYNGDDTMEMHFAAYLDLIGKRYTGAGPQGSYLAMDKSVAKKIIRYPRPLHAVLRGDGQGTRRARAGHPASR